MLGLALLLMLLTSGCGRPVGEQPPVVWQIVTGDGEVRRLEERPATATPAIDEAAARARAVEHVPAAARSAPVQARFVTLTMASDREIWNFQARPAWLITYSGVTFIPEACACQGRAQPANTVVALDGRTGDLVLVYGAEETPPPGQAAPSTGY